MASMRAITLRCFGGTEVLQVSSVPRPSLVRPRDILIQVKAAGINRADLSQREGKYPPPPGCSEILGMEVAGVVEEVGTDVKLYKPGDKVMALLSGGGYAEYAVAHEGSVMSVPQGYSFIEAAAIPEVFLTSWQALKFHGDIQKGHRVLIHAGASGIGTAASQLVEKCFEGTAITTSSEGKVEVCRRYASIALSRTPDETGMCFANKVKHALHDGVGVNVIVDPVFGGSYLAEDASVLAEDGRIVVLAFMGGAQVQLNAVPLFAQRAHIIFSKLRIQSDEYKERLTQSFARAVMPLLDARAITPVVSATFPLEEVAKAHVNLDESGAGGKVILTM